jgi:hypothetical protein
MIVFIILLNSVLKGNAMNYTWRPATGLDVPAIVKMAQDHFETEIDTIFNPDPVAYSRNITLAVVNQFYGPTTELLSVATDNNNNIVAYTWAKSGDRAPWSDDEMVLIKMAHLSLNLSARDRVTLVKDMLHLWDAFATLAKVRVICSTTMRRDQSTFLKLHERHGYDVRGSYAYKKLSA